MTLIASGIRKRLAGRAVLRDASLACAGGETVALVAGNGTGKSTLLRVLAGVLTADAGAATLDGEPLLGWRAPARRRVGYLPEVLDLLPHLGAGELWSLVAALKSAPRRAVERPRPGRHRRPLRAARRARRRRRRRGDRHPRPRARRPRRRARAHLARRAGRRGAVAARRPRIRAL